MGLDEFKTAVDSLEGYMGMVGVMGGEPTLHPKFEEMSEYIANARPDTVPEGRNDPIRDFADYRNRNLRSMKKKRGLWTSLGLGYYRHYETIQDTYGYQCVNDHTHNGHHMALLLPRKDLGISDKDWVKYRDACWLQKAWSSSITPKGAFFCEVAASLDMLFDGPGGWDVEPGWWRRKPRDFGKQLDWCEMCSACLPVPTMEANASTDIVSPAMAMRLKSRGSKKKMTVFDTSRYDPAKYDVNSVCEPYLPEEGDAARVSTIKSIRPQKIAAVIVCVGYDDYLEQTLRYNAGRIDTIMIVTDKDDRRTPVVANRYGAHVTVSHRVHENGAPFAKGKAINDGIAVLKEMGFEDWILHLDADVILPPDFRGRIDQYVLNPGCLYFTRRWGPSDYRTLSAFLDELDAGAEWGYLFERYGHKKEARVEGREGNDLEHLPFGYFHLFNLRAQTLAGRGNPYPEGSSTAENDDRIMGFETYPEHKVVSLPVPEFDVIHLPHGRYQENWRGRRSANLDRACRKDFVLSNEFVCVRDCTYEGRLYKKGETLTSQRWNVPPHFRRLEVAV